MEYLELTLEEQYWIDQSNNNIRQFEEELEIALALSNPTGISMCNKYKLEDINEFTSPKGYKIIPTGTTVEDSGNNKCFLAALKLWFERNNMMNKWNGYIILCIKNYTPTLVNWFYNNEMFDYFPEILSHDYSNKIEDFVGDTPLRYLSDILTGAGVNVEIINNTYGPVEIGRSKKDIVRPEHYITIQYIPGHFQLVEKL